MLYYYCKNDIFVSIITNKSIWLSDMTKSNDSWEIYKYIGMVEDAIDKRISKMHSFSENNIPQNGPKLQQYINEEDNRCVYLHARKKLASLKSNYYCLAICFSDVGDHLSHWQGYGDDGAGVSIGFDEDSIHRLLEKHILFKCGEVQYYKNDKDKKIQKKLEQYFEKLDNIHKDTRPNSEGRNKAIKKWCNNILDDDAPFFKPEGFVEERETRFCFVRIIPPEHMEKPKQDSHLLGVRFHVSKTAIVPHYELSFLDETDNIIRQIVLGPRNDSDCNTIKAFLSQNNFNNKKIDVKKSDIPYRTRS